MITKSRTEVVEAVLSALHQEIGGDVLFREVYYGLFWNGPEKDRSPRQWFDDFQWFTKKFVHIAAAKDLLFAWHTCNPDSDITPTGFSDDQMTMHFERKSSS